MGRVFGSVFGALLFVVLLFIAFGSWYTIDSGDRGVLLRNGAVTGTAEPGLGFKTPWIEDVVEMSVRQVNWQFKDVAAYSQDQQIGNMVLSVNVQPDVKEVAKIYTEFGSVDNMLNRVLTPVVNEEIKTIFGGYTAASAIRDRGKMNADMEAAIKSGLAGYPFQVISFQLENIDWSDTYEDAIEARATAEAQVATQRQTLEKEKVLAEIAVTQAKARADSNVAEAEARAKATRLNGDAEADAIRARTSALGQNPLLVDLTKAERWDGKLPTSMIPAGTVPFLDVGK